MSTNQIQKDGYHISLNAPVGGVVSGNVYVIANLIGVALQTAAAGEPFVLVTKGVFELPKKSADNIALGAKVYWDVTPGEITSTASTNYKIGNLVEAAGASTTKCKVLLNGIDVTVEA
jgi:predicted RecA/RadA family phage recombinase